MALTKVTGQVVNTSTDLTVGVLTATTVAIGGTLTYEDVTNVDSVGLITARNGIEVTDKGVQVGTGATVDSAGDNILTFLTNGSESLRITSDGKVGIGTASPSDNFTVAGSSGAVNLGITANTANAYDSPSLKFLGGNLSTSSILFGDASDADIGKIIYNHDGNSLAFTVNASERMRLDSSGRVLVGATSASSTATSLLLQGSPDGASGPSYLRIATGTATPGSTSTIGQISFTDSGHSTAASIIALRDGGTWSSSSKPTKITFNTTADGASSPTERMRIDSSGRLGIGESSPDRLLHLKAASSTAYSGGSDTADYNFLKIENTTDDKSAGVFFLIGSNGEAAITATEVADGNTDIAFQNRGGGVRSEKLRIDSSGNVGINQSSPSRALEVRDASNTVNSVISVRTQATSSTTNGYAQIEFKHGTENSVFVWHNAGSTTSYGGANSLNFYNQHAADYAFFSNGNNERFRIRNGGGITFNGDTAAANALNDYEQGTWNPTVAFGGSSTGVAYVERQGLYVKIGNLVWASMVISLSSNGSGTGDISISLPFAVGDNTENRGIGTLAYFSGFSGLNSNPNVYASAAGNTTCRFQHLNNSSGSGTQVTTLTHGNVGNSAGWRGQIMYTTID